MDGAALAASEPGVEPDGRGQPGPPDRFRRPSTFAIILGLVTLGLLVHGYTGGATVEPLTLANGMGALGEFLSQAFPPDLSRLRPISESLLVTLEMALLGTIIGGLLSLPLAVVAARNTTPHRALYLLARGFISLCRTIPDLVWGLIFVVAVGLGPQAGVLAITMDVMGFCGRFFAESIEEVDDGVVEGLRSTGASRTGVIMGGVFPSCLPSFVATSMFALESSTRSSVVLGLVGAGGIGIELAVSMQLLRYDEAMTVILAIFVVVLSVERTAAAIRRRVL